MFARIRIYYYHIISYLMMSQQIVGGYKVMEELGKGAFATVYKAQNIDTKKIVALKKMHRLNKNDIQMVKKQIQIMKSLKHKNIVQYETDFRHTNGEWYIVLEYCGKGDMENYKKKVGRIPEHHCKLFVRGILQALVELHKKNIAHRDLKLANILITNEYQLKLADFGFSKDLEQGWTKSFCGTPLSMAPEILKKQKYNQKCDVWSLGILTFIMLYNRPPFYPNNVDGPGIIGITNAVTNRLQRYDPNVAVSDLGKKFMDLCLQKQISKRPYSHQLMKHEWLNLPIQPQYPQNTVSKLRMQAMQQNFQQKPQVKAENLCNIMLNEVIQLHFKQMWDVKLVSPKKIRQIVNVFKTYYLGNQQMLQYYLLLAISKLEQSKNKQVVMILRDKSSKLQVQKIKRFQFQLSKSLEVIKDQMQLLKLQKPKNVNIHKQIVKFAMGQVEMLMQSGNQQEIKDKLYFLKNLLKFTLSQYQNSVINVKWGQRDDLKQLSPYVNFILNQFNEEEILKILATDASSQQDLQSIWLIENNIKQSKRQKNGIEYELGKLSLYILNISSNFTVDKAAMQTDKIQLDEESMLLTS